MFLDILIKNTHKSLYRYQEVLNYLHSRYVTDDEIEEYELGFSKVVSVVKESSIDYNRFIDECWKGRKLENKIIFPIKDRIGNIVGIVGRSIETKEFKSFIIEEAKYTGFFYGLFQALPYIYKEKKAYIVEGPFDLFALKKVLPNVVAAMTSGMSENQYDLIKRYCNTIITIFDSDDSGRRGTKEAMKYKDVRSIDLRYKDPAKALEILKIDKFKEYIRKKVAFF